MSSQPINPSQMSGPKSCPKCNGIMQDSETSLIIEEAARDTKVAVKVQAFACKYCGFIELWKA